MNGLAVKERRGKEGCEVEERKGRKEAGGEGGGGTLNANS